MLRQSTSTWRIQHQLTCQAFCSDAVGRTTSTKGSRSSRLQSQEGLQIQIRPTLLHCTRCCPALEHGFCVFPSCGEAKTVERGLVSVLDYELVHCGRVEGWFQDMMALLCWHHHPHRGVTVCRINLPWQLDHSIFLVQMQVTASSCMQYPCQVYIVSQSGRDCRGT